MENMSNLIRAAILNLILRDQAYTPASTIYVGLLTSLSDAGDTFTEVSGNNYSRAAVTFKAPSSGRVRNQHVQFANPSGSWSTVPYIGLFDAETAGNILFWGELPDARTIGEDEPPVFREDDLVVDLVAALSALTYHAANALLDRILRNQSWTSITPYAFVSRQNPGQDQASLDEPANGYARVDTTGKWGEAQDEPGIAQSSNTSMIEYPTADGGNWGELTHGGIADASSGGNLYLFGALDEPVTLNEGQTLQYPTGTQVWRAA